MPRAGRGLTGLADEVPTTATTCCTLWDQSPRPRVDRTTALDQRGPSDPRALGQPGKMCEVVRSCASLWLRGAHEVSADGFLHPRTSPGERELCHRLAVAGTLESLPFRPLPLCLATLANTHGKHQKAENHEYDVRVARDDTGEGFVVTCDNKCHIDGSRTELVARYVVVGGGFRRRKWSSGGCGREQGGCLGVGMRGNGERVR